MSPMLSRTTTIAGQEVRPGVRIAVPSNYDRVSFTLSAVCESTEPARWHGEVAFAGTAVMTTAAVDTYEQAGRAAEAALKAKVLQLFSQ